LRVGFTVGLTTGFGVAFGLTVGAGVCVGVGVVAGAAAGGVGLGETDGLGLAERDVTAAGASAVAVDVQPATRPTTTTAPAISAVARRQVVIDADGFIPGRY
jgi:hypothetical protein